MGTNHGAHWSCVGRACLTNSLNFCQWLGPAHIQVPIRFWYTLQDRPTLYAPAVVPVLVHYPNAASPTTYVSFKLARMVDGSFYRPPRTRRHSSSTSSQNDVSRRIVAGILKTNHQPLTNRTSCLEVPFLASGSQSRRILFPLRPSWLNCLVHNLSVERHTKSF